MFAGSKDYVGLVLFGTPGECLLNTSSCLHNTSTANQHFTKLTPPQATSVTGTHANFHLAPHNSHVVPFVPHTDTDNELNASNGEGYENISVAWKLDNPSLDFLRLVSNIQPGSVSADCIPWCPLIGWEGAAASDT